MPAQTYWFLGSAGYSTNKRDFALVPNVPQLTTDYTATETHILEFISKLYGWSCSISASTTPAICAALRAQVKNRIFVAGAPAPLSAGNPIKDVYVGTSRESTQDDAWRDAGGDFAIHPVINPNYQQGASVSICVGLQPNPDVSPQTPDNAMYWILADVFAYKP